MTGKVSNEVTDIETMILTSGSNLSKFFNSLASHSVCCDTIWSASSFFHTPSSTSFSEYKSGTDLRTKIKHWIRMIGFFCHKLFRFLFPLILQHERIFCILYYVLLKTWLTSCHWLFCIGEDLWMSDHPLHCGPSVWSSWDQWRYLS